MAYSYLTTAEETEILCLAHKSWEPKVIARRIHRSLGAVKKCINRDHVRTPKERQQGRGKPPPSPRVIKRRKAKIWEKHLATMGCYHDNRDEIM